MSNDAKLGLLVGVGVVIAIAVTFFRKEATPNLPWTGGAAAAAVGAPQALPSAHSHNNPTRQQGIKVRPAVQTDRPTDAASPTSRSHNVDEALPSPWP